MGAVQECNSEVTLISDKFYIAMLSLHCYNAIFKLILQETNDILSMKHTECKWVSAGEIPDNAVRIWADIGKYNGKAQGSAHSNPDGECDDAQENQEAT